MTDPNAAPTVRIVYPANLRDGYCQIPAADFNPAIHTLYGSQQNSQTAESGSAGVESAGEGERPPVTIPDDWRELHHNRKINIAEQIIGVDIEPAEGKTKTQLAEDIISAEVEKQSAGTPGL
jgi:hypothetical protein